MQCRTSGNSTKSNPSCICNRKLGTCVATMVAQNLLDDPFSCMCMPWSWGISWKISSHDRLWTFWVQTVSCMHKPWCFMCTCMHLCHFSQALQLGKTRISLDERHGMHICIGSMYIMHACVRFLQNSCSFACMHMHMHPWNQLRCVGWQEDVTRLALPWGQQHVV